MGSTAIVIGATGLGWTGVNRPTRYRQSGSRQNGPGEPATGTSDSVCFESMIYLLNKVLIGAGQMSIRKLNPDG
jgi:hypothetical protein